MNLFKIWTNSKQSTDAVERKIRTAAQDLVASGKISLDEARRAAGIMAEIETQSGEKRRLSIDFVSTLAQRGSFNRAAFPYDSRGMAGADVIFADELEKLVTAFDQQEGNLETMSASDLQAELKAASDRVEQIRETLSRRFPDSAPSPPPAAAAGKTFVRRVRTREEVNAAAEEKWRKFKADPQGHHRDLSRFESLYEYQCYCWWQETGN